MAQQPGLAAGPQFRCMSAVPPWAAGCYRCWGYRAVLERCPANWGEFCCQVPPYLLGFKVSYCCFQGLGSCPTSKTGFARQSCTLSSIRFSDGQSRFLNPSRILTTTLKRFIATNLPILNSCPMAHCRLTPGKCSTSAKAKKGKIARKAIRRDMVTCEASCTATDLIRSKTSSE